MSIFSNFKSLFFPTKANLGEEVEKLFTVLSSLTQEKEVREDFLFKLKHIRSSKTPIEGSVRLFLDWEDYLQNKRASITSEGESERNRIHLEIQKQINVDKLPIELQSIFRDKDLQKFYLAEVFLKAVFLYVSENLGIVTTRSILSSVLEGTSTPITVSENGFDFSKLNELLLDSGTSYSLEKHFSTFKVFLEVISEELETSLGKDITKELFSRIYVAMQKMYDVELVSEILPFLPDRLLSMDEWLSMLSKTELENRVREKTKELEGLNEELEKRVAERTEELKKAFDDLQELDRRKSEFIFLVGHQMRTPIVAVKWALRTLRDGDAGELPAKALSIITEAYRANESMNRTVNEILLADDIINNKIKFEIEKTSINDIIQRVIEESKDEISARQVMVNFTAKDELFVLLDKVKAPVIFSALLDNAIRYSSPQSIISISLEDKKESIEIVIEDKGIGIPKEVFERIGERFFRADNALRQNTYGSGLGIYITKKVIEGVAGTLKIQSEEGKGTKVIITLKKAK